MSASSEVHEGIKIAAVAIAVTVSLGLLSFASGARAHGVSAEQDTARTPSVLEVTDDKRESPVVPWAYLRTTTSEDSGRP